MQQARSINSAAVASRKATRGGSRTGSLTLKAGLLIVGLGGSSVGVWTLAQQGGDSGARKAGEAPTQAAPVKSTGKAGSSRADIAMAKKLSFEITTTSNGELAAKNQLELRSELERQTTVQFIVQEGTRVKQGEKLVQLNGDEIQRSIDEDTQRLESAKAEVVAAENAYQIQINDNASALRKAELEQTLSELSLRQWRDGDAVKKRQQLETRVDTTELELERLAEKFRRSQELLGEGFLSKDESDRDEVAYINAISGYQSAQLDLDVYEKYEFTRDQKQKNADVSEKLAEVDRVRLNNERQLASREANRNNQRQQLALLETKLEKSRKQLAACVITAPKDGLVVYGNTVQQSRWGWSNGETMQIGTQVQPNELIMVLPDTSEMVANVRVHESLAGKVRPGLPVQLKIDAAGGRVFEGTVDSIGVMAEGGGWRDPNLREYTVVVKLASAAADELKPAMRVEARIILENVEETVTVPIQSLFSEGAVQFVYRPEGSNKYVKQPVRVGRRSETIAEIAAGLSENDAVLLRTPAPGEVLAKAWDPQQLTTAGYETDKDGNITAPARGGGMGRRGKPGGAGRPAEAATTTTTAPKAEEAKAPSPSDKPADKPADTTEAKPVDNATQTTPKAETTEAKKPA
jgi:HlyD family secretion protein